MFRNDGIIAGRLAAMHRAAVLAAADLRLVPLQAHRSCHCSAAVDDQGAVPAKAASMPGPTAAADCVHTQGCQGLTGASQGAAASGQPAIRA